MTGRDSAVRTLTTYVGAGCSPTVALELFMIRDCGMGLEAWALIRGRDKQTTQRNIEHAGEVFPNLDTDELAGRGK